MAVILFIGEVVRIVVVDFAYRFGEKLPSFFRGRLCLDMLNQSNRVEVVIPLD
jgi:hypothetical protein